MNFFKYLLFLTITVVFSCTDRRENEIPEKLSPSEFLIDGVPTSFLDKDVSATQSCNGYVVGAFLEKDNIQTIIHFGLLSNGQLSKIEYTELDLRQGNKILVNTFTPLISCLHRPSKWKILSTMKIVRSCHFLMMEHFF